MSQAPSLPLHQYFSDTETYVNSLLTFATSSEIFKTLCGGVHILDFLTKEPDLYVSALPQQWRTWFFHHEISDILDLLMREDIESLQQFTHLGTAFDHDYAPLGNESNGNHATEWRGHPLPPSSLLHYIQQIRRHSLDRTFDSKGETGASAIAGKTTVLTRNISVGMKPKKIHEVENFAGFIDNLSSTIDHASSYNITHLVDFGSGQNYLGRALASPPYNKSVIAIEGRKNNIDGAKNMDILAKLSEKEKIMRNKKQWRREKEQGINNLDTIDSALPASPAESSAARPRPSKNPLNTDKAGGKIQYIQHLIEDGNLSTVTDRIERTNPKWKGDTASETTGLLSSNSSVATSSGLLSEPQLMVISLHSCGNLVHHGIRSLILNPSVKAVAMVGCCYNLVTERLGPPTHKLSSLRSSSLRLDSTSSACDPQGFPMSTRLEKFQHGNNEGVRLNITARMMAVQAPKNWTSADCESFFTRHFYRALLQRVFLDRGLVGKPTNEVGPATEVSPRGWTGAGEPILIGSLRKHCYDSFTAYVRGALQKLTDESERGQEFAECMIEMTDEDILQYEQDYKEKKKELSIAWSLMAFSAEVVESIIVVDRWLYLREQPMVKDCWVQAVFDYRLSPRNLVVVGRKGVPAAIENSADAMLSLG